MFGYRTPEKSLKATNEDAQKAASKAQMGKAGPSLSAEKAEQESSVRKSIDVWESGQPDTQTKSQKDLPKKTYSAVDSQKLKTITGRRASSEAAESPPIQRKEKENDRVAEARTCLKKGKSHLSESRNLKAEIRTGVTQALDRLFQLVKEADTVRSRIDTLGQGKEKENEVTKKIDEHIQLLKENSEKMEQLKETLERKTYASAAATQFRRQLPEQTALHSVVVTAKDELETGEEVLNKIRKAVNAKEGGVMVERIRKAKDRKVIIGCRTEEERQKVKDRLNKTGLLNAEEIKNKDPLVILRDVLQYNSDEEVLRALRNQNRAIFDGLGKEEDRIQIAYKRRTRNPHTSHVTCRSAETESDGPVTTGPMLDVPRLWTRPAILQGDTGEMLSLWRPSHEVTMCGLAR